MQDQIIALEEQMAKKELLWGEEKERLLKALRAERAHKKKAEAALKAITKELKVISDLSPAEEVSSERIRNDVLRWEEEKGTILKALNKEELMRREVQADKKACDDQNKHLKQNLMAKEEEILFTKRQRSSEFRRADKAQKDTRKRFNKIHANLVKKMKQVVLKNEEAEAKLRETIKSEAEFKIQVTAMEEQMKLLTQQNIDLKVSNLQLQELAQKTDKEKAKMKREAEKATKEAAKRLKKEKKEEEKKLREKRSYWWKSAAPLGPAWETVLINSTNEGNEVVMHMHHL